MKRSPAHARRLTVSGGYAFSLIEVLVASAVLSLVVVLLVQIIGMSTEAIGRSRKKLDAAAQARLFLDRLGMDLSARLTRSDLPVDFDTKTGNDSLRFYTEVLGYQGQRRLSLVSYRIHEANDARSYQAERSAAGTDWGSSSVIAFGQGSSIPPVDGDYEVLADGVFRMEICYVKKADGKLTNSKPATKDIAAIVVAVAAIDADSRKIMADGDLENLAKKLPEPTEGEDPMSAWRNAMAQPGFTSGTKLKAAQSVDVYQRYFSLP